MEVIFMTLPYITLNAFGSQKKVWERKSTSKAC